MAPRSLVVCDAQIEAATGAGKALIIILLALLSHLVSPNKTRECFGKVLIMCYSIPVRMSTMRRRVIAAGTRMASTAGR